MEYVTGLHEKCLHITHRMLRTPAHCLFVERVANVPSKFEGVTFNTTCGRCNSFCERHEYTTQARTTVAQNPLLRHADKIINCMLFVCGKGNGGSKHWSALLDVTRCPCGSRMSANAPSTRLALERSPSGQLGTTGCGAWPC